MPQTCPPGPETDTKQIQATDILRPLRAQERQENHYRNSPRVEQRSSHGPRDPRPWDTSHQPDRAQGPRPWQAATGSEPAHTKAPSLRQREPRVHQRAETPATSMECGGEEIGPAFDGGPKLIQEREQPKT
ncbi:hypothetical protein CRENBAI_011738 [Crenichthys baileyi]|uniref:Uncharacterized protein n=1 Tax=Crenichthys baileyi TaxID=28760 RepID=A0AAV9RMH3_9TELE